MATYYHVAGKHWTPGQPLRCWERLVDLGVLTDDDWQWPDAPVGFDGHVICLWETLEQARDHLGDVDGGTLLAVHLPDDLGAWGIQLERVREGFPAVRWEIPAELLEVL